VDARIVPQPPTLQLSQVLREATLRPREGFLDREIDNILPVGGPLSDRDALAVHPQVDLHLVLWLLPASSVSLIDHHPTVTDVRYEAVEPARKLLDMGPDGRGERIVAEDDLHRELHADRKRL
jgi:hypothetical protein